LGFNRTLSAAWIKITVPLVHPFLFFFAALVCLAAAAPAFAQASATATASAQIIDPVGVSAAAAGSAALAPAAVTGGMAQVSAGAYAVQGQADEVVSVALTLPSSVERVGGGGSLPVRAARPQAGSTLTQAGGAAFEAVGAASAGGAPGGVYAGVAQVVVNLN
jgi:hypothetical protein